MSAGLSISIMSGFVNYVTYISPILGRISKRGNKPITSSKAGGLNRNRSKRFGLLGPVKQAEFIQPFVFFFLVLDISADRLLVRSYS